MFKLKKLEEPFGTPDNPMYEASYRDGMIRVVDGLCEVRFPETRDRLLKLGYAECPPAIQEKGHKVMSLKSKQRKGR
jgi:hypothetical protein